MPVEHIEMWWECKTCGTLNGGLAKVCGKRPVEDGKVVSPRSDVGCGKPIEDEEWIDPDDDSVNLITDAEGIQQAQDGTDWICGYCGSSQKRANGQCASCGGDPNFNHRLRGSEETAPVGDLDPFGGQPERTTYGSSYLPKSDPPFLRRRRSKLPLIIGGVALTLIALTVFIFWPRYVDAEVVGSHWTSTVTIDRYQKVPHEGWEPPYDAVDEIEMGKRSHPTKKVQVGTKTIKVDPSGGCGQTCKPIPKVCKKTPRNCTENKNGTKTCSGGDMKCTGGGETCKKNKCTDSQKVLKEIAIYEPAKLMWYSWKIWEWKYDRSVVRKGQDLDPQPPEKAKYRLNVGCMDGEKERASAPNWKYTTVFRDESGETHNYHPSTHNEYVSLKQGVRKRLRVSAAAVAIVEDR